MWEVAHEMGVTSPISTGRWEGFETEQQLANKHAVEQSARGCAKVRSFWEGCKLQESHILKSKWKGLHKYQPLLRIALKMPAYHFRYRQILHNSRKVHKEEWLPHNQLSYWYLRFTNYGALYYQPTLNMVTQIAKAWNNHHLIWLLTSRPCRSNIQKQSYNNWSAPLVHHHLEFHPH